MALPFNRPALLGKRKRVCEFCARRNQQPQFGDDQSCQSCMLAGAGTVSSLSFQSKSQLTAGVIAYNTTTPSPRGSQPASLPLDSPSSWSSRLTSPSRFATVERANPTVVPHLSGNMSIESSEHGESGMLSMILSRSAEGNPSTHGSLAVSPNNIPLWAAASFFRTYFTMIHPQYPFLDIKECEDYYNQWKASLPNSATVGWPNFFVNMVNIPYYLF
jgi:hypothetical protein